MKDLDRQHVQEMMRRGAQLVDVLPLEEFDEDHLPGAVNMPLRRIEMDTDRLDRTNPVIVYCWDSA